VTLTGQRNLRTYIHNRALGLLQHRKAVVRQRIAVEKISAQTGFKGCWIASLETDAVVHASIVHKTMYLPITGGNGVYCFSTSFGIFKLNVHELTRTICRSEFGQELLNTRRDAAENYHTRTLIQASARNGCSNSGSPASHNDDAIFQTKIHESILRQ
jgi:hypothetical protein